MTNISRDISVSARSFVNIDAESVGEAIVCEDKTVTFVCAAKTGTLFDLPLHQKH